MLLLVLAFVKNKVHIICPELQMSELRAGKEGLGVALEDLENKARVLTDLRNNDES